MRRSHIGITVKSQTWATATHRDRRENPGRANEGEAPRFWMVLDDCDLRWKAWQQQHQIEQTEVVSQKVTRNAALETDTSLTQQRCGPRLGTGSESASKR